MNFIFFYLVFLKFIYDSIENFVFIDFIFRGVVQLFNVVRQRQELIAKKLAIINKGSKTEKRKAMDELNSFSIEKQLEKKKLKIEKNEENMDLSENEIKYETESVGSATSIDDLSNN